MFWDNKDQEAAGTEAVAAIFSDGWDLLWEAQLHQHPAFST